MESKRCPDCDRDLPIDAFHGARSRKSGLQVYCKGCQRARAKDYRDRNLDKMRAKSREYRTRDKEKWGSYQRSYYDKNRERIRAREREAHAARRQRIIEHYGGACACCGERRDEFLAVDHINGGGTRQRVSLGSRGTSHFYLWIIRENFPSDLRILCHNCNSARGIYGYCPHDKEQAC